MDTTLTGVCQEAVQKKGTKVVAAELGVNGNVFGNELNPFNDSNKLGADMVYPVMKTCDDDSPLHFLAQLRGGVFIKLPKPNPDSEVDQMSIRVVKEFGELMAVYGGSLEDGDVSRADLSKILKEGYEALEAIMSMLKHAERLEGSR